MQQIKQELQQTIAKLKGEWGINNFSLQDLAAILEKVVAAVIDQVQDIMHTFNYPYTIPQALLADLISNRPKISSTVNQLFRYFRTSSSIMLPP